MRMKKVLDLKAAYDSVPRQRLIKEMKEPFSKSLQGLIVTIS